MSARTNDEARIDAVEYDREPGHGLLEEIDGDEAADRYERDRERER